MLRFYPVWWLAPLLLFAPHLTAETLAEFSLSNNRLWRGITQTDDKPAATATIEYRFEPGSYIGVWAGNTGYGGEPGYEIDVYAGQRIGISTTLVDVAIRHYHFPHGGKYSYDFQHEQWEENESSAYTEGSVSLTHGGWNIGYAYSNDYIDSAKPGYYLELNHTRSLAEQLGLMLHIGVQKGRAIDDTPEHRVGDYSLSLLWHALTFTASNLTDNVNGRQSDNVRYLLTWKMVLKRP